LGSHLLRTGRYYDHPELYVKTSRANVNEYDDVDTRHRTASEEARQRVIAAQAQTLSTAEIKEYANEVSSLSSKRDAKIIYIEKKLILFSHFFAENFAETNKVVTFAPQMLL
jgi:hypothetical protein